jgi:hypothetical protein
LKSAAQKGIWNVNDVESEEEKMHVIVKPNQDKIIKIEFTNNLPPLVKLEGENPENFAQPEPS